MSDPCAELQPAVRAALKADATLLALFGGGPVKVYDGVAPPNTASPYLVLGEDSVTPELAECLDGAAVAVTVHVWDLASPPSVLGAKRIGAAVQAVLLDLTDLPSHRVVAAEPQLARYLMDADGRTAHGVLTVTVHTEPL